MTRLCAGSFSEVIAGAAGGSALASLLLVDQMLMSIAPNDENAEAFTVAASSPAVNSLRISRSRSTQGGKSKWTARSRPACRTTVAATNPTQQ